MYILRRYIAIITCAVYAAPAVAGILTPGNRNDCISPHRGDIQSLRPAQYNNWLQNDTQQYNIRQYGILGPKIQGARLSNINNWLQNNTQQGNIQQYDILGPKIQGARLSNINNWLQHGPCGIHNLTAPMRNVYQQLQNSTPHATPNHTQARSDNSNISNTQATIHDNAIRDEEQTTTLPDRENPDEAESRQKTKPAQQALLNAGRSSVRQHPLRQENILSQELSEDRTVLKPYEVNACENSLHKQETRIASHQTTTHDNATHSNTAERNTRDYIPEQLIATNREEMTFPWHDEQLQAPENCTHEQLSPRENATDATTQDNRRGNIQQSGHKHAYGNAWQSALGKRSRTDDAHKHNKKTRTSDHPDIVPHQEKTGITSPQQQETRIVLHQDARKRRQAYQTPFTTDSSAPAAMAILSQIPHQTELPHNNHASSYVNSSLEHLLPQHVREALTKRVPRNSAEQLPIVQKTDHNEQNSQRLNIYLELDEDINEQLKAKIDTTIDKAEQDIIAHDAQQSNIIANALQKNYFPEETVFDLHNYGFNLTNWSKGYQIRDNAHRTWHVKEFHPEQSEQTKTLEKKILYYVPDEQATNYTNHIVIGLSHGTFAYGSPDFNDPHNGAVLAPILQQFADKAEQENRLAVVYVLQWGGENFHDARKEFAKYKAAHYNNLPSDCETIDINHSHACNASFRMSKYLQRPIHRLICFNPPMRDEYIRHINKSPKETIKQVHIYASYDDEVVPIGQFSTRDDETLATCYQRWQNRDPRMFMPLKSFHHINTACIWIDTEKQYGHSGGKGYITPHLTNMMQHIDEHFTYLPYNDAERNQTGHRVEMITRDKGDTHEPQYIAGKSYNSNYTPQPMLRGALQQWIEKHYKNNAPRNKQSSRTISKPYVISMYSSLYTFWNNLKSRDPVEDETSDDEYSDEDTPQTNSSEDSDATSTYSTWYSHSDPESSTCSGSKTSDQS